MRMLAPKEALQAHLESDDVGIWAGQGRVVAESSAATIIYLDERFRLPFAKIGNSKVLRATYSDPDTSTHLSGPDLVEIGGANYRFRIRAREDADHLTDIRIDHSKYTVLPTEEFSLFADHLKRAAFLVRHAEVRERLIFVGGTRLRRRLISFSPTGDSLYVGMLPRTYPAFTVPTVNVPLYGMFEHPSTWMVSESDSLVADRNTGIFLQATHIDTSLPVRISDWLRTLSTIPALGAVDMTEFARATFLLALSSPDEYGISAHNQELILHSDSAEIRIPAPKIPDFKAVFFYGKTLPLFQECLDPQGALEITRSPATVTNIIFRQPERTLVLAALRR